MSNNGEERSVVLNFLAGLGLGALIGAAAALLVAPKSGTETRDELKSAADDLRQKANKVVHDLSESSDELLKKSKEILDTTKEKVQGAIEAGRTAMARKKEDIEGEAEAGES